MHLILTHENADFDAIASLVAAALLYPDATAVVPFNINQNVRDFLTLYWDELPLTDPRDRPNQDIDQITLVDVQQMPDIKGVSDQTRLRIIDHHTPGDNVPSPAQTIFFDTGANVTYLIEEIVRANVPIKPLHATLMLCGIHEDTGSLTYNRSSPRDANAVAWLMEQGAYLDIMREFLSHGLNPAQQQLYDLITENIEARTIHGNQIISSAVAIETRVQEISSLAPQLQARYDPDGLFLLIAMDVNGDPHIQLIARSITDGIHVGHIAEAFGGGGHPRAAAARIEGLTLAQAREKLLATLEAQITPAVTVRQIMSNGVLTLSPEQTMQDAAAVMVRYGYEGYPVVEGDNVVGILTRREIDKAMRHQLGGGAVKQFMHQGEIIVSPTDTVETLQQIMLREQVGQIPVVETGKIIGVVTRTDVINLLAQQRQARVQPVNLVDRLTSALPAVLVEMLRDAGREAEALDSSLYLVGGVVRDLLLNRSLSDVDLVVEGDAIALGRAMEAKHGGRLHTHQRFGTANWITGDITSGTNRLDFVTARTEFYQHPSALPEVEPSSIKQDLHRRDFTINTLALALNPDRFGNILDFYGGYQDIHTGVIRVLHSLSFVEDPTRILRAIRFEQRFNFQMDARTSELLTDALDMLSRVTPKRIWSELAYIFNEAQPEKIILRLDALGVLHAIQADLSADDRYTSRCNALRDGLDETPWAAVMPSEIHYLGLLAFPLTPGSVEALNNRLKLPGKLAQPLSHIQAIKQALRPLKEAQRPSQIYALLNGCSEDALLVCWLAIDDSMIRGHLISFSRNLRHTQPHIDGKYLIETFKLRPSPQFHKILNALRDARLDDEVSSLEDEHALVEALLTE